MSTIRAFIGINIPNHIKSLLKNDFLAAQNLSQVKWVEPENYHINLKFFKSIGLADLNDIKSALDHLQGTGNFIIRANGLIFFPNKDRIKIVAVGLEKSNKLNRLQTDVHDLVGADNRRFRPHITLGRLHNSVDRSIIDQWLDKYRYDFEISVSEICLFESTLTSDGPIYKIIHKVQL